MAEQVKPTGRKGWSEMSEHIQNRIIHLVFSVLTIMGVVAATLNGYWAMQAENQKLIARVEQVLLDHQRRLTTLEGALVNTVNDRLAIERRITGMEIGQQTMLTVMQDLKIDVRAVVQGLKRP